MYIVNEDKVKSLKRSVARRMINAGLEHLAHKGGKVGRFAAKADSFMSRHLDKNKGIYAELK